MARKSDSEDSDPVACVEDLGEGSNIDSRRNAEAAAARRESSGVRPKTGNISKPEKKAVTQQKTSGASKPSSSVSNTPKPSVSNEPKQAPKKSAPPVIRKPVISNKPQPAPKN